MKRQKIWLRVIPALILVMALGFTGCGQPTDSEEEEITGQSGSASGGVYNGPGNQFGEVSGLVVDAVTGAPVKEAKVTLGGLVATTNDYGIYYFSKVQVGDHPISVTKDGYLFNNGSGAANDPSSTPLGVTPKAGVIIVSPTAYKDTDPYAEYEALVAQLDALKDWVNEYPDPVVGAGTGTWTYQGNGVFVGGDGTTVEAKDGEFIIKDYRLNYDYAFGVKVLPLTMIPLTGELEGKIEQVFEKYNNVIPAANIAAASEIEFLVQATAGGSSAYYGPEKTKTDGTFTISGLPTGTGVQYEIVIPVFDAEKNNQVYTYLTNSTNRNLYTRHLGLATALGPITANGGTVTLGTLYFFTVGNPALVTSAELGTIDSRLPVSGGIKFTFSKAMNPSTLSYTPLFGGSTLTLVPSWSTGNTVLTLSPATYYTDGLTPRLPFGNTGTPAGTITFATTFKAADGSDLYPTSGHAYPVWTELPLQLLEGDVVAAPTGLRAAYMTAGDVVKLTFSKELATDPAYTSAIWETGGAGTAAVYRIDPTNAKILYVYPPDTLTNVSLSITVAAADDPSNKYAPSGGAGVLNDRKFSLTPLIAATHENGTPIASNTISIAQNQDIILEFNTAFTTAATATLYFRNTAAATSHLQTVKSGTGAVGRKSITISPDNLLVPTAGTYSYVVYWSANGQSFEDNAPIAVTVGPRDITKGNPTKAVKTITGLGLTSLTPLVKTAATVSLDFTPPRLPFDQSYTVLYKSFEAQAWTTGTTINAPKDDVAVITSPSITIPGGTSHLGGTDEHITYKLRGIDERGYVVESNSVVLTFQP
jgi:hypothetical protein